MQKYAVHEVVGTGSFGTVHKGENLETKETVALKLIKKRKNSAEDYKNLRHEFEIQRKLCHPNIIRMLDSYETEEHIVVVTEFAPRDLFRILTDEGPLPEARVKRIVCDLISALYYLHFHRVLHRDLKPQNVLIEENGTAKLCDFGFARCMGTGTYMLTSIKGTLLYMAPELIHERPYDHTVDLWSLGCIIFECLAGSPPFYTHSVLHLLLSVGEEIKWPDFLSADCLSFLRGLLQKEPTERLSWPDLLRHPFIDGSKLNLDLSIDIAGEIPLTHPLTASQALAKEKQRKNFMYHTSGNPRILAESLKYWGQQEHRFRILEELQLQQKMLALKESPEPQRRHSDNCVLQSSSSPPCNLDGKSTSSLSVSTHSIHKSHTYPGRGSSHNPQKMNKLITDSPIDLNKLNDKNKGNFLSEQLRALGQRSPVDNICNQMDFCTLTEKVQCRETNVGSDFWSRSHKGFIGSGDGGAKNSTGTSFNKKSENPRKESTLQRWMLEDDPQHIECEEWLSFLQKTMEEVMSGEVESMKQENFVTMLIAPLRNSLASSKVIEYVACLLSLPFVVSVIAEPELATIKQVYLEVRTVPNLIYASHLLSQVKDTDSDSKDIQSLQPDLGADKLHALECIYLLLCHLVHSEEEFLIQFCDAIYLLNGVALIQQLLRLGRRKARVVADLLAILIHVLQIFPQNASLVEHIVLGSDQGDGVVDLGKLLSLKCPLVRARSCILIRLLGHSSSVALNGTWTSNVKCPLEKLLQDPNDSVRTAAEDALKELKQNALCCK